MTKMIEVKTADLIGPALDWAVAKAEGLNLPPFPGRGARQCVIDVSPARCTVFEPSTNWSQAGPLLTKYRLEFSIDEDTNRVGASLLAWRSHGKSHRTRWSKGPHHLTAACRAIVAAKLGDTVQVPAGLLAE